MGEWNKITFSLRVERIHTKALCNIASCADLGSLFCLKLEKTKGLEERTLSEVSILLRRFSTFQSFLVSATRSSNIGHDSKLFERWMQQSEYFPLFQVSFQFIPYYLRRPPHLLWAKSIAQIKGGAEEEEGERGAVTGRQGVERRKGWWWELFVCLSVSPHQKTPSVFSAECRCTLCHDGHMLLFAENIFATNICLEFFL